MSRPRLRPTRSRWPPRWPDAVVRQCGFGARPHGSRPIFDVAEWRKNRQGVFITRLDALVQAEAAREPDQRTPARLDLARFYMARGIYQEAKAVLDLVLADAKPGAQDPVALIMHSVASILMGRPGLG